MRTFHRILIELNDCHHLVAASILFFHNKLPCTPFWVKKDVCKVPTQTGSSQRFFHLSTSVEGKFNIQNHVQTAPFCSPTLTHNHSGVLGDHFTTWWHQKYVGFRVRPAWVQVSELPDCCWGPRRLLWYLCLFSPPIWDPCSHRCYHCFDIV